jgi:hypothetical protein
MLKTKFFCFFILVGLIPLLGFAIHNSNITPVEEKKASKNFIK